MPLFAAQSIIKLLNRYDNDYDIIHGHRIDYAFAGSILKRTQNTPFVVTCHGSDVYEYPYLNDFNYSVTQEVLRTADAVIAVGTSDAKILLSLGLSRSKLKVVPNGFDEQLFHPNNQDQARRELDLPSSVKIMVTIASLLPVKGHFDLLKAIKTLTKKRKDFLLFLIGSGPLETVLCKEIRRMGLEAIVRVVGAKPQEEIPTWLAASDFVVLSSLNEGFPTVIPEAFSCGRPVIGTNVGSISDALSDAEMGMMVEPGNHGRMSNVLDEALNKEWDSSLILRRSRKYSLKSISKQIMEIYEYILK
jgi:glycosyltransferase involved in cell wall biosynthesis